MKLSRPGWWSGESVKPMHDCSVWTFEMEISSIDIDELVQERRNFMANAMKLCPSYTNPSIWSPDVVLYCDIGNEWRVW